MTPSRPTPTPSTCSTCGQPRGDHAGPLCARCATERAAHRLAKAQMRADEYRRRTREDRHR